MCPTASPTSGLWKVTDSLDLAVGKVYLKFILFSSLDFENTYQILYEEKLPHDAVMELMARGLRGE